MKESQNQSIEIAEKCQKGKEELHCLKWKSRDPKLIRPT